MTFNEFRQLAENPPRKEEPTIPIKSKIRVRLDELGNITLALQTK